MNKEQLQELYNEYIERADHCFDYARKDVIIAAGLSDRWDEQSEVFAFAAEMLRDKCNDNDIILTHKFSKMQLEINQHHMEETVDEFSGEEREDGNE